MPLIEVSLIEGHTVEEKRRFAEDVTELICKDLKGVTPEMVWVKITDMPAENFGVAGTLIADR
ncbi:MAG: tautomerase family protein [Synergistaceae bacterium]|jgi:4-oxalocrotonate tautomerase family enzyme|nr:tautomerase family protein [Synergistaceae bacterium]